MADYTVSFTQETTSYEVSFTQAARGPAGDPASVTNSNVNAAIETDPAATRDSLGLGTAATEDADSFATSTDLDAESFARSNGDLGLSLTKQENLISGTNIKTINGASVLGSGDLSIVSDLTSGPVTSSNGVSSIADEALSIAKTSGLDTALSAPLSPFFSSELRRHQTTASLQSLTVLCLGDSMMNGLVDSHIQALLESRVPIVGYALDSLTNSTVSGTIVSPPANSGPTASPELWDTGKVWKMSSGAVLRISKLVGGSTFVGVLCSKATVWCSKQSGGGTATVDYSRDNGSTWTSLGTIDTSLASGVAGDPARGEFSLPSIYTQMIRITATGGPVNVVGAKLWDATRSGVIIAKTSMGGITVGSTLLAPSAMRDQVGSDLGRSVMLYQFREGTGELSQETLDEFLDNWRQALPVSEFVLMDQLDAPQSADNAETAIVNGYYSTAASERTYVKRYNVNAVVGNDAYRTAQGWNTDIVHLSTEAWKHVAADMIHRLVNDSAGQVVGNLYTGVTGSREVVFGNRVNLIGASAIDYTFIFPRTGKQRLGTTSVSASGNVTRFGWNWTNPADTFSDGIIWEFYNDGGVRTPWIIDSTGYSVFGPFNATTQSGYTRGARMVVDEDTASKACLLLKHLNASATNLLIVKDSTDATVATIDRLGVITGKALVMTPDSQTATTAAVSVSTSTTALTTTAPAQAITLANGVAGQIKTIMHVATSGGGTAVLTPATKTGYTTVTFTNVGDTVTLQYFTTIGWMVISSRGAVIA